jgi:hypothetical protein
VSEQGSEIRHSVFIRAPREKVWTAFTIQRDSTRGGGHGAARSIFDQAESSRSAGAIGEPREIRVAGAGVAALGVAVAIMPSVLPAISR